jgi:hypothetical protein
VVSKEASNFFDRRRSIVGDQEARRETVEYINKQWGVSKAGLAADGATIWIVSYGGFESLILTYSWGRK